MVVGRKSAQGRVFSFLQGNKRFLVSRFPVEDE